jgi:hypothetical protein
VYLQQDNNDIWKFNKVRYCIYFEYKKERKNLNMKEKKLLTEQTYELLYIDWVQNTHKKTQRKQSNKEKNNCIASDSLENTLSALVTV